MISYDKLWLMLFERKITKTSFCKMIGTSYATISRMEKGGGPTPRTLNKICASLHCQPGDVMEYIPDDPDDK